MSERGFCSEHNYEWWGEDRCPLCTIAIQAALIEVLEAEQVAWRKFTDEANNTMDSAEATIATQAAAIEALEARARGIASDLRKLELKVATKYGTGAISMQIQRLSALIDIPTADTGEIE